MSRDSPRMQPFTFDSNDHKSGFLAGSPAFVKFHESGEEEGPLSKMSFGSIQGVTNCL